MPRTSTAAVKGKRAKPKPGRPPEKNYRTKRLIGFTPQLDDGIRRKHRATGRPIVTIAQEAIYRDVCGGLPVLGAVPCGDLKEALMESEDRADPGNLLNWRPGDFFLRASGDSMEPNIKTGDMVLVRPDVAPALGEVCVVLLYEEPGFNGPCKSTMKKVFHQAGDKEVLLKADNTAHKPKRLPADLVKVVGVFRGLIRTA